MFRSQHWMLQAATVTALMVAGVSPASAQMQPPQNAGSSSLGGAAQGSSLAARDPLRERLQDLNERQLKAVYFECGRIAADRRLEPAEVEFCSIAYDILLRRHFAGDYGALQAWAVAARN